MKIWHLEPYGHWKYKTSSLIYTQILVAEKKNDVGKVFKHKTFYISVKFCRGNKMENTMSQRKRSN